MSEDRVEQWKRKLLDLSMRNPLLNARDGRKFLPIKQGGIYSNAEDETSVVPYSSTEAGDKMSIESELAEKELKKRLKELYTTSRSMYNESGINSLFLAVGFLNWKENNSDEFRHAPLLLVPAELIRQNAAPGYKLQRTDEDAVVNFCLVEMLRSQFGLEVKDSRGWWEMGKRWIYGGLARIGGGVIQVGGKKARVWGVGKFSADLGRFQIDMGNLIGRFKGAFFIAL